MKEHYRLLYIHPGQGLNGASVSLRLTMQAINREQFTPVVGLLKPDDPGRELFQSVDVETLDLSTITAYTHTTTSAYGYDHPAHWWGRLKQRWHVGRGMAATVKAAEMAGADLVHLNSVVLIPSALGLARANIPFVWHVREYPVEGLCGWRTRWIRHLLMALPRKAICLSRAEARAWMGEDHRSLILPNPVDRGKFDRQIDRAEARRRLAIPENSFVIFFVGGVNPAKGTVILLEALQRLRIYHKDFVLLMPYSTPRGAIPWPTRLQEALAAGCGPGTYGQQVRRLLSSEELSRHLKVVPPSYERLEQMHAAADCLVFPSLEPHFAQPVTEASVMGRASIGSRLPGVSELIEDGVTGYLVEAGQVDELAAALCKLMDNRWLCASMGNEAFRSSADKYSLERSAQVLEDLYLSILEPYRRRATFDRQANPDQAPDRILSSVGARPAGS